MALLHHNNDGSLAWEGTASAFDLDNLSNHTPSSASVRSTFSFSEASDLHLAKFANNARSPLLASRNVYLDMQAKEQLGDLLGQFILFRCSLNEHCNQEDFDSAALDALSKMPFLQALQTVEHYSASVSARIQKRSAYLMGILRGQEAHWEKFVFASGLVSPSMKGPQLNGKRIGEMPAQLLAFLGQCCMQGNCLPSDFTPEVCLSLHKLPINLAVKAVSAFNTNKRIVAGAKGGVINRSRFFLRLIQNVSEQSVTPVASVPMSPSTPTASLGDDCKFAQEPPSPVPSRTNSLCSNSSEDADPLATPQFGVLGPVGSPSSTPRAEPKLGRLSSTDLNLEELASIDFSLQVVDEVDAKEARVRELEAELRMRAEREKILLHELNQTRQKLHTVQGECFTLRNMLGLN